MDSCAHIIIEGRVGATPNMIKFGKASGSYSAQTLTPFNSTNVEVRYVEVRRGEVGIFANPSTGPNLDSMYFHHNYIHDLRGTSSSEAFYIGNTGKSDTTSPRFTNLRITDNTIEDVGGDGIQVCCAPNFLITRNTITDFGQQSTLGTHCTGILLGGNAWGTASYNTVTNGRGSGMQVLGYGTVTVNNNSFLYTGQQLSEQPDAIYISKRGGIGSALLTVNLSNNIITGAARYGVNNDGNNTAGGVWACNVVTGATLAKYRTNGDVVTENCTTVESMIISNTKYLQAP